MQDVQADEGSRSTITLYEQRLAYCSFLLTLMRRYPVWGLGPTDWPGFFALCDRFERCLSQVYPPTLVWEGDYN